MTKARDLASAIPAPSTVSSAELGYLDGVTSAIQTQVDAKIANTLTTTTGDIIYASGANTPARRAIGSTGNVLTVAGGVPTWAAPAGGGKVLQVVSTTYSTDTLISSTSMTDTGISLSITPTANTSKILVLIDSNMYASRSASSLYNYVRIVRDSTAVYGETYAQRIVLPSGGTDIITRVPLIYLDSPATTSSTTYKMQARNAYSGQTMNMQYEGSSSSITLLEIGA